MDAVGRKNVNVGLELDIKAAVLTLNLSRLD